MYLVGTNPGPEPGRGYMLYRWDGEDWKPQYGDPAAVKVAVAPDGRPWAINEDGEIRRKTDKGWEKLNGTGKDISIGADGTVYLVGTNPVRPYRPNWENNSTPGWNTIYALTGVNIFVLAGGRDGGVRALDPRNLGTQLAIWKLSQADPVRSIALHREEAWAVVGTQDGLVHLLSLTQSAPVQTLSEHMGSVATVAVSVEDLVATGPRGRHAQAVALQRLRPGRIADALLPGPDP